MVLTMERLRKVIGICLALPVWVWAAPEDPLYEYFTFQDAALSAEHFADPMALFQRAVVGEIDLMEWQHHDQAYPDADEPYNRQRHFGGWVRESSGCLNTRAQVLIRDSRRAVGYESGNSCLVSTGEWLDPYSGAVHTRAADVQIDHVVALRNAYGTGAARWDRVRRCLYANDLVNPLHLLAVDGGENNRKSDKSPADWMPSSPAYHCAHLANWLRVKRVWGLVLAPRESRAIAEQAARAGCDEAEFHMSRSELSRQQREIQRRREICLVSPQWDPGPSQSP